ncbi:hypothetical protein KIPB_014285, partial [Kipferlia bialata]
RVCAILADVLDPAVSVQDASIPLMRDGALRTFSLIAENSIRKLVDDSALLDKLLPCIIHYTK